MLVPFLIMVREGLEAALIVGIVASYLAQTGQRRWMPAVWVGVTLAVLLSLAVGLALVAFSAEFPQREQELFEAVIAFIAVTILTSMVFWLKKAARSIKQELHGKIDDALHPGQGQGIALIAMVFLAVTREGLESVFFLLATFQQSDGLGAPIGALAGVAVAVLLGYGIYKGSVKLNFRRFFLWTGVFILFVAAGLLASGLRALHEAGLWNSFQATAFDLSGVLPRDSALGSVLAGIFGYNHAPTWGEVFVYVAFLAVTLPLFFVDSKPSAAPSRQTSTP
jgi:high-affinity iron transporter